MEEMKETLIKKKKEIKPNYIGIIDFTGSVFQNCNRFWIRYFNFVNTRWNAIVQNIIPRLDEEPWWSHDLPLKLSQQGNKKSQTVIKQINHNHIINNSVILTISNSVNETSELNIREYVWPSLATILWGKTGWTDE